ncbi:MAG: cupin domain-containing protein [Clostridiales bacterium]|nr:cupin domain-containing protein [Clostridiales bacterium]
MKIDFNALTESAVPHFKGGELDTMMRSYMDDDVKIMINRLIPGASVGMHTHETSCEIIYILSGTGTSICDGLEEVLTPGCCQYCKKGGTHTLMNNGKEDLVFFAVVPEV